MNPDQSITMYQLVYDWAKYVDSDMGKIMDKKKIGVTGALKSSKKFFVTGSENDVQKASFTMLSRAKFSDMGVGKGQPLSDVKGNKQLYTAAGIKGRVAKKFIYNTIYPQANTLLNLLAENFNKKLSNEITDSINGTITFDI